MVSFYSSLLLFPLVICISHYKRSVNLRVPAKSNNLSAKLGLSFPYPICFAHFLRAIFWITCLMMLFLTLYKIKCKVLSLMLEPSAISPQPFLFSFFCQLLFCFNCSACLSLNKPCGFSSPSHWSYYFCCLYIKIHLFLSPSWKPTGHPPTHPFCQVKDTHSLSACHLAKNNLWQESLSICKNKIKM